MTCSEDYLFAEKFSGHIVMQFFPVTVTNGNKFNVSFASRKIYTIMRKIYAIKFARLNYMC